MTLRRKPVDSARGRRAKARRPLALLLTHSEDFFTIDRVQAAVERHGWRALRFDTDTFPLRVGLAVERTRHGVEAVLELPEGDVRLSEVRAVWLRRLWGPRLPEAMSADDAAACTDACAVSLHDTLAHCTPSARWVNPLEASTRAESKVLQLRLAHELGFDLPDTTLTNSAAWVERLRQRSPGLITKLITPLSAAMQTERFVYTSAVEGPLEGLRYAPQLFQPRVPRARELRVVVVGDTFFVGSLDPSALGDAALDWRRLPADAPVRWQRDTLPAREQQRVRRLMKRLGLVSGALDFIVTPEGRHVFLEINPAGEWGWLERNLGFDISGAFARALTDEKELSP